MKYTSKTAALKAFKAAVNNQSIEVCDLGSIGVQVYNLWEGSEYEVITEFGKNHRGHYYIKTRDNGYFTIKNLTAFDLNEIVERWERVQAEAKAAAEQFAQTGRVIVEAEAHAFGFTCSWDMFCDACADLEAEKENTGIYEDLGIVAGCAETNTLFDGVEVITEGAKAAQATEEAKEYTEKESRYNELEAERAEVSRDLHHVHTEAGKERMALLLRRSAIISEQERIYKRLAELDRRREYFCNLWPTDEPQSEPETATEGENDNEQDNTPTNGGQTATEDEKSARREVLRKCYEKAAKACGLVAEFAKVATSKAVAFAALALGAVLSLVALFGSGLLFGELLDVLEASGVVFPGAWRGVVCVVFLFTVALDLGCWVSLQYMRLAEKCHAFAGFDGIYYRGECTGVFVRPFSVIGRLVHEMRTA